VNKGMAERETKDEQAVPRVTPGAGETGAASVPVPRYEGRALFGNARELVIEHAGHDYRLRVTRQGKLILTK
jgi:hemin uptake protein HemP